VIRVLVVDDSAFARKVLRDTLSMHADIDVVDIARDGLEALEKIQELKPDVITLDLVMPGLDGLGVLRALPAEGGPRVVVVSISNAESELGVEALQLGAITVVHKPTALATDRLYELSDELVKAVRSSMDARPRKPAPVAARLEAPTQAASAGLIVVGASTGGPQALTHLVRVLPADLAIPVALVLHIPAEYTAPFAQRLDSVSPLDVVEAEEGMPLVAGRVVVARGGMHLKIAHDGDALRARLDLLPLNTPHRPSVDVLFASAAAALEKRVLGVVLTGMGDDGLEGSRAIRSAGGRVITEDESTCVVYGMPRAVDEAGLATASAPLDELPALLLRLISE
jgi:two-component system, chemotaxis family, protein-glutamate methylesterase/glutaminase